MKEEEDITREKSSEVVVVGLLDFISNWWGDVKLTPAQTALVKSKPADYWEIFKDEIAASKWLQSQDFGKVLALHRNVVDCQYRTYETKEAPPLPPQPEPKPEPYDPAAHLSPSDKAVYDEFTAWMATADKTANAYDKLRELQMKHGRVSDDVCRALGMIYYAKTWHF